MHGTFPHTFENQTNMIAYSKFIIKFRTCSGRFNYCNKHILQKYSMIRKSGLAQEKIKLIPSPYFLCHIPK